MPLFPWGPPVIWIEMFQVCLIRVFNNRKLVTFIMHIEKLGCRLELHNMSIYVKYLDNLIINVFFFFFVVQYKKKIIAVNTKL